MLITHCSQVLAAKHCNVDSMTNGNKKFAKPICGLAPSVCPNYARYRSYDGSCNNLDNPGWGTPLSPYGDLVQNNYDDGVNSWPTASDGTPLPNARKISLKIFEFKHKVEKKFNLNTQQWGQIVTHDMSLAAGVTETNMSSPVCCNLNGQLAPDVNVNPLCHPIGVPDMDTVHKSKGWECMNFIRTISTKDKGCTKRNVPAIPLSVVTPYMDLSLTYGNSEAQAISLREGNRGRLLTTVRNGHEWPPQADDAKKVCHAPDSSNETCYGLGDSRGNQTPQLTVLHIILLKEHNRVADELAVLNPHWNDETIFQEARRILIAEMQYINYYEYLKVLLGENNMIEKKLIYPNIDTYVNDYDSSVNPAVYKEHASAAFRHFHTLIRGYLDLITENRELSYRIRLSDWFNKPSLIEKGSNFDGLTRGLTYQPADKSDQYWDLEITRYLFRGNGSVGGDLRATDIQRGRDHGLGTYTQLRDYCDLPVPKTFKDLKDYMSSENVKTLKSLYKSVEDIDLVVGGSLEFHAPGALVGPTFLCIILEQFLTTRISDRYFFENGIDEDIAFTLQTHWCVVTSCRV
ncbi:unnamed protein product, partial [Iphiclides podalirius]